MALRFIRRPSDVPSISNIDDARSIRYAYGGQDGFVQKAGNELSYTIVGNTFKINSGIVVLQGWESEIDSNGWAMTIDTVTTKRYYSVYYEVNLSTQTTEIKSVYNTAEYPEIDAGDDLTAIQNGTARLLLYQFATQNGEISDVSKKVVPILFLTLASNRPPITSIEFIQHSNSDYTGDFVAGTHLDAMDVLLSAPTYTGDPDHYSHGYAGLITYLPKDSINSIAKAEFTYSYDFIKYILQPDGKIYGYVTKDIEGDSATSPALTIAVSVKAVIIDLYGNRIELNWDTPKFRLKRLP